MIPSALQLHDLDADLEHHARQEIDSFPDRRRWLRKIVYIRPNRPFSILLGGRAEKPSRSDSNPTPRQDQRFVDPVAQRYTLVQIAASSSVGDSLYHCAVGSWAQILSATDQGRVKQWSPSGGIESDEAMWVPVDKDDTELVRILSELGTPVLWENSAILKALTETWPFYVFRIELTNTEEELFFFKKFDPCTSARQKFWSAKLVVAASNLDADRNPYFVFASDFDFVISPSHQGMWVLDLDAYDQLTSDRVIRRATSRIAMDKLTALVGLDAASQEVLQSHIENDPPLAKIIDSIVEDTETLPTGQPLHDELCSVQAKCSWAGVEIALVNGSTRVVLHPDVSTRTIEQFLRVLNKQSFPSWANTDQHFAERSVSIRPPPNPSDTETS